MRSDSAINRLRSLRVSDVMNENVITVSAHQPMVEVAELFRQHDISAAPVIDATSNRFVGMLSATDFIRRDSHSDEHALGRSSTDGCWEITSGPLDVACSYMSKAVQSITPDAPLLRAAMIMSAEHIHRLPVLNGSDHCMGIISTMDMTAAIVNIVNELDAEILQQFSSSEK